MQFCGYVKQVETLQRTSKGIVVGRVKINYSHSSCPQGNEKRHHKSRASLQIYKAVRVRLVGKKAIMQ